MIYVEYMRRYINVARPTLSPKWAETLIEDQSDKNGNFVDSRSAPPEVVQTDGLIPDEPMPRQWINHQFWLIWSWIVYLDELTLPLLVQTETNVNPNDTLYVEAGQMVTTGVGALTIYLWRRI
jgi:hypothetical protein